MEISQQHLQQAAENLDRLIRLLGLNASVTATSPEAETVLLTVTSEEAGRIIGRKGRTLSAIQLLLNGILRKDETFDARIQINIDGYEKPEKRERGDRGERAEGGDRQDRRDRGERAEGGDRQGRRERGERGDRGNRRRRRHDRRETSPAEADGPVETEELPKIEADFADPAEDLPDDTFAAEAVEAEAVSADLDDAGDGQEILADEGEPRDYKEPEPKPQERRNYGRDHGGAPNHGERRDHSDRGDRGGRDRGDRGGRDRGRDRGDRGGRDRGRDRGGHDRDRGGRDRDRGGRDYERGPAPAVESPERARQQALDAAKEVKRWGEKVTLPPMTEQECRAARDILVDDRSVQIVEEGAAMADGRRRLTVALAPNG